MKLNSQTYSQLSADAIDILITIKSKITDDSDFTWVPYNDAGHLRQEIDRRINDLKLENRNALSEIYSHFLPTATFQEHSMSNGWSDEYMTLAIRFDKIYEQLKS